MSAQEGNVGNLKAFYEIFIKVALKRCFPLINSPGWNAKTQLTVDFKSKIELF